MYVTLDQKITVSTTRVALLFAAEVEYADHTYTRRWIRNVSQGYLCDLCHESQHVDDHMTRRLYKLRYVQKNGTMYPRPRPGCQESGLRPIDQSRGVHDKPADGLGTMSWFSSQILICFIAYIFKFSIPLWFGLQTLYFRTVYSLPIVIRIRHSLKTENLPASVASIERLDDQNHLEFMLPDWKKMILSIKLFFSAKFANVRTTLIESFFKTIRNLILFQLRI